MKGAKNPVSEMGKTDVKGGYRKGRGERRHLKKRDVVRKTLRRLKGAQKKKIGVKNRDCYLN